MVWVFGWIKGRPAGTSIAAVNELFGGKSGLARAIFAEGFARLAMELSALGTTEDPEADVIELSLRVRSFARQWPHLYDVMFSQPFAEFRPGEEDRRAAAAIHRIVLSRVAAILGPSAAPGTAKDIAIGLFAVVQGLVSLESSGMLGSGQESIDRRFHATVTATLRGFVDTAAVPTPGRGA